MRNLATASLTKLLKDTGLGPDWSVSRPSGDGVTGSGSSSAGTALASSYAVRWHVPALAGAAAQTPLLDAPWYLFVLSPDSVQIGDVIQRPSSGPRFTITGLDSTSFPGYTVGTLEPGR